MGESKDSGRESDIGPGAGTARHSDRPCILYDGQCPFCRRQIERIRRRDRLGQFEYLPFEAPEVKRRYGHLDLGDLEAGLRLIIPEPDEHSDPKAEHADHRAETGHPFEPAHKVYTGPDAVVQIARRITPWRPLAWLSHLPGARRLFGFVYRWIARHRHRLGQKCDTAPCRR
jgi:predicted DCC family thiol-disulfide oxidoreductase YuxK